MRMALLHKRKGALRGRTGGGLTGKAHPAGGLDTELDQRKATGFAAQLIHEGKVVAFHEVESHLLAVDVHVGGWALICIVNGSCNRQARDERVDAGFKVRPQHHLRRNMAGGGFH